MATFLRKYFGLVNTVDVTENVIFLEDVSGILCQITTFYNAENGWKELLTFPEGLPYPGY